MRTSIALLCLVTMLYSAPSVSNAADFDSEHREVAEALFETMHVDAMLSEAIDRVLETRLASNAALAPYRDVMKKFFNKYMSAESLKEDLVAGYMETFTTEELREIVAFYSTPTGQKMLTKAPEQAVKGIALGQQRIKDHSEELRQMVEEESKRIQELQKDAPK